MSKPSVYIINFKVLYNIISEIKQFLNFDLFDFENEKDVIDDQKKRNDQSFIVLTKKKSENNLVNNKQIITVENYPFNLFSLVEKINSNLLMQQYNFQSNINIKEYMLNLNSRNLLFKNNKLKLTEREIEIILFIKKQKKSININTLQKEVWGYSEDSETHTVETHVYRLRKKLKKAFNDNNFIKSDKEGYFI
jgi:DNA-binding response OmpR family regulator